MVAAAIGGGAWYTAEPRGMQAQNSVATTSTHYVPLAKGSVTFNKHIAPIIFDNCTSCHRAGEVAPFSLQNYQDVKKRARQIALVTQSRYMPPWKADEGAEKFHDARRLSLQQIGLIQQWVQEGAPQGNAKDLPSLPKFTPGWKLGAPDAVFQPTSEYSLQAEGDDVYRCFVLPTNYDADRYLSAFEIRSGNARIVHHVIAYLDTKGEARKLDERDAGPGYTSFGGVGFNPAGVLGGWAPGNMPRFLPAGVGTLLPKGADIVLQVHYHPSGKPESDLTKIGVYFSKTAVDKQLHVYPVANPRIRIPAGDANYLARASMNTPVDVTVLQLTPHMHLLGRSMRLTATPPGKQAQTLVNVPNWDFNWQTTYALKEPVKLPRGSRIDLEARYDNSANNPLNPSTPPKTVTWGEQTTDEMCIGFVHFTVDAEHLTKKSADALPEIVTSLYRDSLQLYPLFGDVRVLDSCRTLVLPMPGVIMLAEQVGAEVIF
jgi:hypothetical protein